METEIKLRVEYTCDRQSFLKDSWLIQYLKPGTEQTRDLHSWYFDTKNHVLKRKGIVLRLRQDDQQWFITVKRDVRQTNGLHHRREWSERLLGHSQNPEDGIDPHAALDFLLKRADRQEDRDGELEKWLRQVWTYPLEVVCETRFTRWSNLVSYQDTVIELAYDQGLLSCWGHSEPINECELELLSGPIDGLIQFGQQMARQYHFTYENRSKFARCMALCDNHEED
jgi:triphosphatase